MGYPVHNDPVATRTGIVIGGAYVPRRPARYADPIEMHPITRRGHRAVVVVGLVILGLFALGVLR
jgi:hypothetical protein